MTKIALALVLLTCLLIVPYTATAQTTNPFNIPLVNVPVTNLVGGTAAGTFNGNLDITRFFNQNGQLMALALLTGTVTNTAGQVVQTLTNFAVSLPITSATGSCPILTLDLGPLHLDLLGLVVDLNAIHLNITAQSGPGNLLGNLLCAVANLLNGGGPLGSISGLLNNLLRILG